MQAEDAALYSHDRSTLKDRSRTMRTDLKDGVHERASPMSREGRDQRHLLADVERPVVEHGDHGGGANRGGQEVKRDRFVLDGNPGADALELYLGRGKWNRNPAFELDGVP